MIIVTGNRPDGRRIIEVNGVGLCVDTAGEAADPAILLIAGLGSSMDWWEEEFCQRLAAGRRFVIRYDHRDTGQSVSYPAGTPGYTGADLAADAAGVLDALGRRSAHLAGISMGGALAQQVALAHPGRVDSLVLISTSPAVPGGPGRAELPTMSEDLRAYFAAQVPPPDWTERTAVIDYVVDYERRLEGAEYFDEAHVRALVERIVDRTRDMAASMVNHALAGEGELARGRLDEIAAPTLVIHGTADPLFPYGHAEALAREIPRAELLPLEGVGHQMPPRPCWTSVIPAMLRHTGKLALTGGCRGRGCATVAWFILGDLGRGADARCGAGPGVMLGGMASSSPAALSLRWAIRGGLLSSWPGQRGGGQRVADGQAASRVEELQVARVNGELKRLPVPDPALLGDPGRPQRLAAHQGGRGLVFVRGRLGRLGQAGVLDVRRVNGEDHHDLAAQLFDDPCGPAHRPALALPRAASSKSDGRIPRMSFLPK